MRSCSSATSMRCSCCSTSFQGARTSSFRACRCLDPATGDALSAQQSVTRLAGIRYPPPAGRSDADRAADASFLSLAKDRLAALAYPARGLTIAYTALFSRSESRMAEGLLAACSPGNGTRRHGPRPMVRAGRWRRARFRACPRRW